MWSHYCCQCFVFTVVLVILLCRSSTTSVQQQDFESPPTAARSDSKPQSIVDGALNDALTLYVPSKLGFILRSYYYRHCGCVCFYGSTAMIIRLAPFAPCKWCLINPGHYSARIHQTEHPNFCVFLSVS